MITYPHLTLLQSYQKAILERKDTEIFVSVFISVDLSKSAHEILTPEVK